LLSSTLPVAGQQYDSLTEIVGGEGGSAFTDQLPPSGARVVEVQINSGDYVDSVQIVLALPDGRTVTTPRHGGSGGRRNTFRLDSGEYIVGISGRCGDYIDSIQFQTNRRESQPYGGGTRDYQINVPAGNQVVGFTGRAGIYLDAVGLIFSPISPLQTSQAQIVGGRGGSPFTDPGMPGRARIVEIRIRSGERIDAVQAVYALPDGRRVEGPQHGGRGGKMSTFLLDSDEYVTAISGRYGDQVDSLVIQTNKRTSQRFGGRGGREDYWIKVPSGSQAAGFTGRAGEYIDAIGLTYVPVFNPSRRFQLPQP
jgi:hypothetical protein